MIHRHEILCNRDNALSLSEWGISKQVIQAKLLVIFGDTKCFSSQDFSIVSEILLSLCYQPKTVLSTRTSPFIIVQPHSFCLQDHTVISIRNSLIEICPDKEMQSNHNIQHCRMDFWATYVANHLISYIAAPAVNCVCCRLYCMKDMF